MIIKAKDGRNALQLGTCNTRVWIQHRKSTAEYQMQKFAMYNRQMSRCPNFYKLTIYSTQEFLVATITPAMISTTIRALNNNIILLWWKECFTAGHLQHKSMNATDYRKAQLNTKCTYQKFAMHNRQMSTCQKFTRMWTKYSTQEFLVVPAMISTTIQCFQLSLATFVVFAIT